LLSLFIVFLSNFLTIILYQEIFLLTPFSLPIGIFNEKYLENPTGNAGGKDKGSSLLRENWLQSLVRDRKDKNLLGLVLGLTEFLNFIDYI